MPGSRPPLFGLEFRCGLHADRRRRLRPLLSPPTCSGVTTGESGTIVGADDAAGGPQSVSRPGTWAGNARREGRGDLRLIYLTPNLEGLLFRLHPGREAQFVAPQDAARHLQRLWPGYRKPASAVSLSRRFDLHDLLRTASCDLDLRDALTFLGLLPGK